MYVNRRGTGSSVISSIFLGVLVGWVLATRGCPKLVPVRSVKIQVESLGFSIGTSAGRTYNSVVRNMVVW